MSAKTLDSDIVPKKIINENFQFFRITLKIEEKKQHKVTKIQFLFQKNVSFFFEYPK